MRGGDGVSDVEIRRNEIIELLYKELDTSQFIAKALMLQL